MPICQRQSYIHSQRFPNQSLPKPGHCFLSPKDKTWINGYNPQSLSKKESEKDFERELIPKGHGVEAGYSLWG